MVGCPHKGQVAGINLVCQVIVGFRTPAADAILGHLQVVIGVVVTAG